MASTPTVFGDQATRQIGDMVRWWNRDYRNPAPPPPRQPVIRSAGAKSFWGILTGKKSFLFEMQGPPFGNRFRGEFSWVMGEETESGLIIPKEGGLFGIAGEADAAHEVNRSNANMHLEHMRVRIWVGPAIDKSSDIDPSEEVSSHFENASSLFSTNVSYWFDVGVPREDRMGVKRFFLSHAQGNDQLP